MKRQTRVLAGAAPAGTAPDDYDEQGQYLYPGHVEDALPESELARWLANYLKETILRLVAPPDRDSAHANMPIYYQRGSRKHVAPDAFYLPGVPFDRRRKSYRIWETGRPPRVVFEILSSVTAERDKGRNPEIYEKLGVEEYYWFDPDTGTLEALELERRTRRYRVRKPKKNGRYDSPALGLEVGIEVGKEGAVLGLFERGQYVPPMADLLEQAEQGLQQAKRARKEAEQARQEAEQRLAERERQLKEKRQKRGGRS